IFKREIQKAADKEKALAEKEKDYREKFANPFLAANHGYIDAIIEPSETRPRLIRSLHLLRNKVDANPRKKHGNIPL
ncbi:MAG: methylmalonyl-CoA carboxyltransferase, partial [Ignavibacteria bacterium]|nr:methylmalonyl-CoA carboxyltransferase [Ignavibacteria bacterium]